MTTEIALEPTNIDDAVNLHGLINQAYRGQHGWTRETEIVEGERSSLADVIALIQNPATHLLVSSINGELAACICVEEKGGHAYISTFAVKPAFQNQGIGKQVLNLAEKYAVGQLGAKKLRMVVISQREELISFYERRGYRRSGEISGYPVHLNAGVPVVEGLTVECLEKLT